MNEKMHNTFLEKLVKCEFFYFFQTGENSGDDLKKIQNEYLYLKKQNDVLMEKIKKSDR